MANLARQLFTFDEYVELEEIAGVRHEFLAGQVWAMSGGSPSHAGVTAKVAELLGRAVTGKPCRVFSADLRIRAVKTGLGTYPDVSVFCGSLALDPDDRKGHTATNPKLLVEVLSPSTEAYDRGEKLAHYQTIETLSEVVLIAHDRKQIEVVRREADGSWSRHVANAGDSATLESIGAALPVDEVYRDPLAG
jgi:Uma2 family endonuclease